MFNHKLEIIKKVIQNKAPSFGEGCLIGILAVFLIIGLLLGGPALYEVLLLLIIIIFIKYFLYIIKKKNKKELSLNQQITLLLTLAIVFFAFIQVWVAFYAIIPRVYTSNFKCQENLIMTPDGPNGHGNFSLNLGNYGELPAWFYQEFQNTTTSLSIGISDYNTIVLVPITYQDNKQTEFVFNFRTNGNDSIIGFKLRYLIYGDDIIDKTDYFIKRSLNMFNELPCNYEKIDKINYKLVKS